MKLSEIAALIGADITGGGDLEIDGVAPLEKAEKSEIAFIRDFGAAKDLARSKAGAIIAPPGVEPDRPAIVAKNPLYIFAKISELLSPEPAPPVGVHQQAVIGKSVTLGKNVSVGPLVVIGNGSVIGDGAVIKAGAKIGESCHVGDLTTIFENVVIYDKTVIGARCRIHANTTIGSDGFGYTMTESGVHYKIPQNGMVRIEDDVEIGACCSVDRAAMGETLIKAGVKIDNQVQIAHNVVIGKNAIIAGCSGLAGSVTIEDGVVIGGMVCVSDHVTIKSGAIIAGNTGVATDIEKPGVYSGIYAIPHMEHKRFLLSRTRLDRLEKKIKNIEKKSRGDE